MYCSNSAFLSHKPINFFLNVDLWPFEVVKTIIPFSADPFNYTHAPPATINVGLRSTVLKASIYLKPVSEILKGLQRLRPQRNVLVDRRTRIYCWHACASSHDECLSRASAQHCIEGKHVLQVHSVDFQAKEIIIVHMTGTWYTTQVDVSPSLIKPLYT